MYHRSKSLLRLCVLIVAFFGSGFAPIHIDPGDASSPTLRFTSGVDVPYHVHTAGYSGLPFMRVRAALERAFTTWEVDCSTLRFVRDPNGRDGLTPLPDDVSVLRFEERQLPREVSPDHTLAFTSHVGAYCNGVVAEADITFNAVQFDWTDQDAALTDRVRDIESIALHEIGHLFGLDHSDLEQSAMFFEQRVVRRTLHRDDRAGVCAIYAPALGGPCRATADCQAPEVCQLQTLSDGSSGTRCSGPLGPSRPGQRCDASADVCSNGCANGFCLEGGSCSAFCERDADCPAALTCFPDVLEGGGPVGYCLDVALCEADIGLCPAGQACIPSPHPTEDRILRACVDRPGRGAFGSDCASPDVCTDGVCVAGRCARACDVAADCPAPYACLDLDFPLGAGAVASTPICQIPVVPCDRPEDCAEGLVCRFRNTGDATVSDCVLDDEPRSGPGEPCANGRDCDSGFCLARICTGVCAADADCPSGMACDRLPVFGHARLACVASGEAPAPDAFMEPDAAFEPLDALPAGSDRLTPAEPVDAAGPTMGGSADLGPPEGRADLSPGPDANGSAGGQGGAVRQGGSGSSVGLCSSGPGSSGVPLGGPLSILAIALAARQRRRFP